VTAGVTNHFIVSIIDKALDAIAIRRSSQITGCRVCEQRGGLQVFVDDTSKAVSRVVLKPAFTVGDEEAAAVRSVCVPYTSGRGEEKPVCAVVDM
jgi:hypothetical protein